MAVKPILQYRNADSTLDLNSQQARIVDRAIFDGGSLTPSGVSLQVTIDPFIATGYDGLVAISDAVETRSVPAPTSAGPNRVSYLILHLEYRNLTTSISNLQVVPESTWLTSISREFFVTFASFSVPFGATSLTGPGVVIDYSVGDWADKLGKTGWRAPVATVASLPTTRNLDGDVRIALDTRLSYQWSAASSTWTPLGGVVNLAEVASRSAESRVQYHRVTSGSGFVNEIPKSTTDPGTSVAGDGIHSDAYIPVIFPFIPQFGSANLGTLPGCHYLMNGHFIKTHATNISFSAPPGVGERYDLLLLEAWRVTVALPSAETYADNAGAPTSFSTLRTALERLQEQGVTLATSYDLSEMEAYSSSSFVATRYQYRVIANVAASVLTDTSTVAASITNVDGNAFSVGTNTDQKLWQATSTTGVDGVSWALPLVVVRRTSAELAGPPFIDTFRSNQRYVFDVAPRAELGMGLFEVEEALKNKDTTLGIARRLELASGFVTGTDASINPGAGTVTIPPSVIHVHGRTLYWSSPSAVTLPAPPATGGRTDLVVLEVFKTIYPTDDRVALAPLEVSERDRIGTKAVQWYGRFRTFSLPLNVLQTTPEGAMTATTVYTPSFDDPALWGRSPVVASGEDPNGEVYALPICLVHRRNTGAYVLTSAGQNGADRSLFPGLPNRAATFPYESEILDVRARTVADPDELQFVLDESLDRLVAGDLRTKMATHTLASSVAGTQLLQVDQIAPGATAGLNLIPNPPNGQQTVWAESDEAELFTWSFDDMDSAHAHPSGSLFSWDPATNELEISLPPGYMLSLNGQNPDTPLGPQGYIAYSIETSPAGNRRPIPMNFTVGGGPYPLGYFISGDAVTPQPMRQTIVTLNLNVAAGATYAEADATVMIGVWAVKRNHEAGRSSAFNSYQNNRGLFAVPDKVHRIEYSTSGLAPFSRSWVGVPLVVVDVPVVGDVLNITRATLFASGSISSQLATAATDLQVWGVANITLSSTSSLDKLRYIQFMNDAVSAPGRHHTRIEFTPASVPGGTTARVTLICTGDLVNTFCMIDAGSKQIRGLYTIQETVFSITASAQHQSSPASTSPPCGWNDVGIGVVGALTTGAQASAGVVSALSFGPYNGCDISFYAAGTAAAAWEIWFNSADRDSARNISSGQTVGLQRVLDVSPGVSPGTLMNIGAYAPVTTVNYAYTAGVFGNHSCSTVTPVRVPLPSTAVLSVFYDYTPYQGITDDLETRIVGSVEAVSDQLVFTNGPNKPWIDYRLLGSGIGRGAQSSSPPGTYHITSAAGADFGLLYSKGRVSDRGLLSADNGPVSSIGFVVDDTALPYRSKDRPVVALSQRLPYPTKAGNGASVGSRYSPESFLSHTAILDYPVVRSLHPNSFYARSEVSPWVLEYSGVSSDERVWRSQDVNKTLYVPLPVNIGERIVGLTIELESAGPAGFITGSFSSKSRETGVFTAGTEIFYAVVASGAGTRRLNELAVSPVSVLSSSLRSEVVLALVSSASNLRVGQITISVVPTSVFTSSTTIRRYPYSDYTQGVGKNLRKGSRIEIPSTWTTEFAAFETALLANGRQDFSASPARGRSLVATVLGQTTYGSGGMIGYVPSAGVTDLTPLGGGTSSVPSYTGRDTAAHFNMLPRDVLTGASAPDVSVGTALAYMVHNAADQVHMGVSTGYSNISQGSATVRVGQAVDAFVPVGRPVFRRS